MIAGGDFMYFIGNSVSQRFPDSPNEGGYAWWEAPGALVDQINARWGPVPAVAANTGRLGLAAGAVGKSAGAAGRVVATQPGYKRVVVDGSGQSGATAQQIADNLVAILPTLPLVTSPVFVIEGGINDAFLIHGASETIGQYNTGHDLIYTRILARYPAARIVDLTCFCLGELHTGSAWGANTCDAEIATVNAAMAVIAANRGGTVVDLRAPLLAWEIINNPGNVIGGFAVRLEGNNVHPTLRGAIEVMAPAFISAVGVRP